jgi:hypothetical protein
VNSVCRNECRSVHGCKVTKTPILYYHLAQACQYNEDGTKAAMLASFANKPDPEYRLIEPKDASKGVMVSYENGDATCDLSRILKISITCGKETDTFDVYEDPARKCRYFMSMTHPMACLDVPVITPPPACSAGCYFLFILALLAFVYVLGGCVYNYRFTQSVGVESCPHVDFWRGLPGLVVDGFNFLRGGCKRQGHNYDDAQGGSVVCVVLCCVL